MSHLPTASSDPDLIHNASPLSHAAGLTRQDGGCRSVGSAQETQNSCVLTRVANMWESVGVPFSLIFCSGN